MRPERTVANIEEAVQNKLAHELRKHMGRSCRHPTQMPSLSRPSCTIEGEESATSAQGG